MSQAVKPDRYVSFVGIDGDGNSRELIMMLRKHIDDPQKTNAFWEKFKEKLEKVGKPEENSGRSLDELYLIHAYMNNISELFETYEDQPALDLLEKIEAESC
ncbi:MAG: N(2)-fixation sustaining protein CowN [Desulfuromonadaceae bacterium]|nr:N(2)-fixation sustaining protein CowN [Desulfuromonadaceae bacterium]MDD2856132.1 N(2)-fixation sustaining protein CowN [Desulfuromonadaceae bacterium]